MKMPPFEYACPATIAEAVALLASQRRRQGARRRPEPDADDGVPARAAVAAGRSAQAARASREIKIGADGVRLGAMVRWRDIEDDARLATAHPLLKAAIAHVAHYQIRNRGTVGGSIAHADPAAEMPGIAVTCDAEIAVVGKAGARVIKAGDFFHGRADDGARSPTRSSSRSGCRPGRRRGAGASRSSRAAAAISPWRRRAVLRSGCRRQARNAHIGVIGVGDRPLRLPAVEAVLNGKAVDEATIAKAEPRPSAAVDPQDDIHASAAYRQALTGTMVERALKQPRRR